MHRYTIRDQYVNKSSFIETTQRESPLKEQVRHDSLFVAIIHNPNLLALRRRATANTMIPTMIQPSVLNLDREMVVYVPPAEVPIHQALQMVS